MCAGTEFPPHIICAITCQETAYFWLKMADKMKQPLGTIKTWVRTALQVLREELSEVAA